MSCDDGVWIGADPGGKGSFGLAILNPDGSTRLWCVNCADEAIKEIGGHLSTHPKGIGVDAPLWWSSGLSGDRLADQWLRKTYRLSGGEVQAANSLRGAALVQGLMFIQRIRDLFPGVPVTETHPKAVLRALDLNEKSFSQNFSISFGDCHEHERDAVISAAAAREGFSGRWKRDLALKRHPSEQNPQRYWLAPIHYFWPEA
jgi:predicted nuclease with RNAse H fold